MKKILILLLAILTLQVQGQSVLTYGDTTYYPRASDNGAITYRQVGYCVVVPKDYNSAKQYPVWMLIHGRGERSEGKLANLRDILLGMTISGVRQYAIATDDFKTAINQFQFIGVVLTYASEFNPVDVNYVLDDVERNWSVDKSREAIIGFSLGGGAVVRYITSSLANAQRVAFAVACAPVNWATNYKNVTDAQLPVVVTTNRTDPEVSPSNAQTIATGVNSYNPQYPAKLIVFPQDGHGSINEMLSLYNSNVPQSIYPYLNAITKDTPKAYPTSTPTTPPPVTQPPITTLTAIAKEVGITNTATISLDGSDSKGATGASWGCINVPAGVNPYTNFFPKGSGWYTVTASLPKEGAYTFVLNAYNSTASARDTIVVTYQKTTVPVPVVPTNYDSVTGYLTLSDGSRVQATATLDFSTSKVIIKDQAGVVYTWSVVK